MTFDEWHKKQLGGDPDNCPHEAWERKAWEAATKAEREECAKVAEQGEWKLTKTGKSIAKAIRSRSNALK